MPSEVIKVPDLGGAETVEVIEVSVKAGDQLEKEDTLVVLESDKASMDVPSPESGKVEEVLVKEGDKVREGDPILKLTISGAAQEKPGSAADEDTAESPAQSDSPAKAKQAQEVSSPDQGVVAETKEAIREIIVPELGTEEAVDIVEMLVVEGDTVAEGDNLLVLETDKATVELPVEFGGTIETLTVKEGGKLKQGQVIGTLKTTSQTPAKSETKLAVDKSGHESKANDVTGQVKEPAKQSSSQAAEAPPQPAEAPQQPAEAPKQQVEAARQSGSAVAGDVYAGPAVRKFARKLGVDLSRVKGSGPRERITHEDVEAYVKGQLAGGASAKAGSGIPAVPEIDFSQFGEISVEPLTKIQKLTAANMARSWLNVPHVTQFDDADITEIEAFRQSLKKEGEKRGVKLTPLAFLLLASARALLEHPAFNRSLSADGESFVQKNYCHIGVAVDTPKGLLVPVIRNVDQKGLWQLAEEASELALKARDGKLKPAEMQGGCFTISSLGPIGGTGFTPIVNTPEVAILGVSKSATKPVWDGKAFQPRLMLPLGLSYDHRAINGADAGRFMTTLVAMLADPRRLAL